MFTKTKPKDAEWQKKILLCGAIIMIACVAIFVYAFAKKEVQIVIANETINHATFADTVEEALLDAGITWAEDDLIEPALESSIAQNQTIKITRAFDVTVKVDGKELKTRSLPTTVKDIMHKLCINIGELDKLSPSLDTELSETTSIQVVRVQVKTEVVNKKIAPGEIREEDDTLEKGITKVLYKGRTGVERLTYQVTYEDGAEVARELTEEKTITVVKDKIVAYGTITVASRGGHTFNFTTAKIMEATAYSGGGTTKSGVPAQVGVIATDPKVIPLGTKLYVEGYGYAVSGDIGSAIKGNIIDIYLETEAACIQWGRRMVKVYILE